MENNNNAIEKVEQVAAQNRLDKAKMKMHKKAERQKAKLAKVRERDRLKMQRRERQQRLQQERQEREELRAQNNVRERGHGSGNGRGGFIAAIISLSVATLVLSGVLMYTFLMPSEADTALEASYNKAFYDTIEQVENIDLNLSKALASKDAGAIQKYLVDTAINSELAENDLQELPLKDESKYYTTKLINQIGDYAKYLNNKLIAGDSLSKQDYQSLRNLYNANVTFKETLHKMLSEMGEDYSFSEMANGGKDLVVEGFDELQNVSVEYPELIYDGPFSDGLDDRELKGLSGGEITPAEAKANFIELFSDYELENIENVGETFEGIECYNVQATVESDVLYAQFSKVGGKLIMFALAGDCKEKNFDKDYSEQIAEKFLEKQGITNMKAVWVGTDNNVYTFNFAYEQDGVICYSDLIKVRVCADSGRVLGMEASSYYINHTERTISKPAISKASAQEKVSDNLEILSSRLVVVPLGEKAEKLCYEFSGVYDGATYYAYIDAVSGRQVELFKVVQSTEGELLM